MIDQDEIRKAVALQNNVWLGENDPMLQSITIFEKALEQSVSTLNEQQQANLKALINAVQKGTTETSVRAKAIVEQGTEHACDQISAAITATMDEGREQIRKDIRLAWEKIEKSRKEAAAWAIISSVCAALTAYAVLSNVF